MAQPVRQVAIRSPGYQGLNTEQSPINSDPEFALVADNAVMDMMGRLCNRNAFSRYLDLPGTNPEIIRIKACKTDHDDVHGTFIEAPIFIHRDGLATNNAVAVSVPVGDRRRAAFKNGKALEITGPAAYGVAMELDGVITPISVPAGYNTELMTGELVSFKDDMFLFAKQKPFCKLDLNAQAFTPVSAQVTGLDGSKVSDIDGDIAISAYGRLWVSGVNGNYHEIHYSSLLDETQWYDASDATGNNTGGVIDVREYWPVESDSIVGIHAHNGLLLVFGRNSILIYANADAPDPAGESGIQLQDAVSNVGLVRRDAICNIGTDVLFVDESGVRTIGRVIQERSNPIQEASVNVRREIQEVIQVEMTLDPRWSGVKMEYLPSKSLAVMICCGLRIAYVFHLNMPSKMGGFKVTRWSNCFWNDTAECRLGGKDHVYMGGKPAYGLLKYEGFVETDESGEPEPYIFRYESQALALAGQSMQTIIPKSIHFVCMGSIVNAKANALWGFDDRLIGSREFYIETTGSAEYNISEFAQDEFMEDGLLYRGYKINTTGSGSLFRVGLEIKVQGGRYALQEFDINSAVGRLTA